MASLTSCADKEPEAGEITVTDDLGNSFSIKADAKAAACHGSLADAWQLSGGTVGAVTRDAIDEHGLKFDTQPSIIGSVKEIDLEALVGAGCDYVLLSLDLTAHRKLSGKLSELGLAFGYFRLDSFSDYKSVMERFCEVNGGDEAFYKNVTVPEANITKILQLCSECDTKESVLLIRAYSGGIKAKAQDNLAGVILEELGIHNIANDNPSILEDISYEYIIEKDPDRILVLTMGDEAAALAELRASLLDHPAMAELTAIKDGRVTILPKELFHYKPNERFDESYEFIAKIFFPEIEQ